MLRTARLTLRRPESTDADAIFSGWAHDPETTRWLGWPTHQSIADTRNFLEFADREWQENGFGAFLILEADRLIGSTGLHCETRWGQHMAAMVALAPTVGLARIEARCHVEHRASARVLEKCGFTREGILQKYEIFPNLGRGVPEAVECWARIF